MTLGMLFLFLQLAAGLRIADQSHREGIDEYPNGVDLEHVDVAHPASPTFDDSSLSFGQGCPDPQHPKVAICVAGISRAFTSQAVTSRFEQHMFAAAIKAGAVGLTRPEPDVFVHIKTGENTPASCSSAAEKIHATAHQIESGYGPSFTRDMIGNPSCFTHKWKQDKSGDGTRGFGGLMSFYHSVQGCYDMMKEAETKHNQTFDVVVFQRPDHYWDTQVHKGGKAPRFEHEASDANMKEVEDGEEGQDELQEDMEREAKKHHTTRCCSQGGAPVERKLQCSKSMFAADLYSFQTRAAFEKFGNIFRDQFKGKNPHPSICTMKHFPGYEGVAMGIVDAINDEVPESAIYSNVHIDASKSGVDGRGPFR